MDYDSAVDELSGLKAAEAKKQSDPAPSPTLSIASTALSGFNRMEEVTEAERRKAEEVAKFAAALTHFSAHITVLLGRVGGLELVKIAGEMTTAPIFAKGGGGEDGIETGGGADEGTPDQTPEEARLSRRDLNTLYQEAEQVRVAGSISNEPNGRLVRLLNLLLVNIQDAVSLMAPNPTPVSNFYFLLGTLNYFCKCISYNSRIYRLISRRQFVGERPVFNVVKRRELAQAMTNGSRSRCCGRIPRGFEFCVV